MTQAITLIREPDASDERVKEAFRDIKESLRVSFVESLFQAYAANAKFLDYVWRRLRPSMLAPPLVASAKRIADDADRAVASWPVSDHTAALLARNYNESELRKLRETVELFRDTSPKVLIVACALRAALGGEPVGGAGIPFAAAHVERDKLVRDHRGIRVALADEREAPLRVRTAFDEMQRAGEAAHIPIFYRALGAYPDWLEVFWSDAKAIPAERRRAARATVERAADQARQLPYPLVIDPASYADMVPINDAFCAILPNVIVDVAYARRGIGNDARES